MTLRDTAAHWHAEGRRAMVVEVASHKGSVPRESGTRMLVATDSVQGTIGGGHLELKAIADARARMGERFEQRIALGPTLGQCCGGALTLDFSPLDDKTIARWTTEPPLFTLQLYGAGHVGRAIVKLLAGLNCRVQWIDEREEEFPSWSTPPHIERVCVEPVEAEVAIAPPGCHYLVLTHSHDLDLRLTEAILKRNDFAYFGLIGSKTKRARFEHRLEEKGVTRDALERMICPIGVRGIEGKEPEVIAVAVVAQLLQGGAHERAIHHADSGL